MAETRAETPRRRNRRRTILVRPAYQLRVAATVLLSILVYSLLFGVLIFYPLHEELIASASVEQQARIARVALDILARLWPAVVVVALLAAIQSIFVTHRIVGPAFHVGRVLHALAAGELHARAHLRRWDRLKELEAATNRLGEALLQRERARQAGDAEALAALARLRRGLEARSDVPPDVRRSLGEIERMLGAPQGPPPRAAAREAQTGQGAGR
jgi:hypothetical protein